MISTWSIKIAFSGISHYSPNYTMILNNLFGFNKKQYFSEFNLLENNL